VTNSGRVSRRAPIAASVRRAALLLGGVAVPFGWLLAAPALGATVPAAPHVAPQHASAPAAAPQAAPAAGTQTASVGDAAEAWYAASPVDICTTPLGCPPAQAPTSPYPANTLHVGVAGGQETARTYLLPDVLKLPFGFTPVTATMTLPVATGASDGTQSPDTAHLVACLATQPFTDGDAGSTKTPPKPDCSTSAKPHYDAKKHVLTLDATAFMQAWAKGTPPFGIALLPDSKATQPTDSWHIAINGRKRAGTPHVTTSVTFTVSNFGTGPTTSVPTTTSGAPTGNVAAPPPAPATGSLPGSSVGSAPAAPPVVAGAQQPTTIAQQPVAFTRGFAYPLAFLVPLALLLGGVFFARLFTRDATPLAVR